MRFQYPITTEMRLIAGVKNGDRKTVRAVLDEIEADFSGSAPPPEDIRYLAESLRGTLLRLDQYVKPQSGMNGFPDCLAAFDRADSPASLFDAAVTAFDLLCKQADAGHIHKKNVFAADLRRYIQEYFLDPAFCFTRFADHFHLSETAMSRLFKELTGTTFSAYLEQLRMEHAYKLIQLEKMTVAETARRVCYSSPQAFRRAYKRYHGQLPGTRV